MLPALLVTIWFKEVSVRECHVSILSGRHLIKKSATSLICQILRGVMGALPVSKVFTQLQQSNFIQNILKSAVVDIFFWHP